MGQINDLQFLHVWRIGRLIEFAYENGYRLSPACARCVKQGHHKKGSLHYAGLATDFNLFLKGIDGKWRWTKRTEDHKELGEFWEMMGGAWGGRWNDGNHYSTPVPGKNMK